MTHAWVVDLPLPAVPVTSTMPCCTPDSSITWAGMPRSRQSGMSKATTRITAAMEPRCRYTFTRNRARPGTEKEKSSSPSLRNFSMGRLAVA